MRRIHIVVATDDPDRDRQMADLMAVGTARVGFQMPDRKIEEWMMQCCGTPLA